MSKERFFKGTFLLTSAGLISRIMGFFYRIFLSHTIGAEGIGLYQLVVPLQHLVLAMTTFGIQTSLSRLISSHTALGEKKRSAGLFPHWYPSCSFSLRHGRMEHFYFF